jgi:hypothetical protein
MTDPAFKPGIEVCTPLIAGNKQSLRLQIATNRTVRIAVPLGDVGTALMTVDQFNKKETQISLRPLSEPDGEGKRVEGVPRPEGLEELTPRTADQGVGYIEIPITADKVFVFNIWISDFIVQKDRGSVAIELRAEPDALADPWTLLDTKTAEKVVPEPRITSFTASRYNVGTSGSVTLRWTIEPAGNFELKAAETLVKGEKKGGGDYPLNVRNGMQDFILEAWAGEKKSANPDTRRLHIEITSAVWKPRLEFSPPDWPDDSTSVLGLYAHRRRGRLYGLLRFGNSPYASLWYTEYGFDASRTAWREARRKPDPKKPDEPLIKPSIPVAAARRPGAIFGDKLFLIGGDCCSPNSAGSGVGFCELNEDTGLDWQEVGENEAWSWPKGMAERMGHAVVVVPDKEGKEKGLWIMGGWRQDGGICEDIWQFNGTQTLPWEKVDGLQLPRCLFGATATPAAMWTVGGFGSPGGTPNDAVVRRCAIGAKSWDRDSPEPLPKIPLTGANADYRYCASVLFSREGDADKPYGIATFWNVNQNAPERQYFYFEKIGSWQNSRYFNSYVPEELAPSRNWYHMQSAVFRDAVFFRTLTADESWADNKIYCFVFEPK